MFESCKKLNSKIILKNLNNVKDVFHLFYNCEKLKFKNIESVVNQLVKKLVTWEN